MMGSIPGGVRGGLMELFYGVYEKDADRHEAAAARLPCSLMCVAMCRCVALQLTRARPCIAPWPLARAARPAWPAGAWTRW